MDKRPGYGLFVDAGDFERIKLVWSEVISLKPYD